MTANDRHPRARARRAREDGGYALVTVMMTALVLMALVLSALAVADSSSSQSGRDAVTKRASAAARAGVALYATRLAKDPSYWQQCSATTDAPVWTGTETPRWQSVESGGDRYTIELLPAPGYTACDGTNPASVFDPTTSTIKARVTGQANGVNRTFVAQYRRGSFLEYVYYTDLETLDPVLWTTSSTLANTCRNKRTARGSSCREIQFAPADAVTGIAHTNDSSFLVCGAPAIERGEATGTTPVTPVSGCSGTARGFYGSQVDQKLPQDGDIDELLYPVAQKSQSGAYLFSGRTTLRFDSSTGTPYVYVTRNGSSTETRMAMPSSGVIYVQNGTGCTQLSAPASVDYTSEQSACAITRVSGTVGKSVTVYSQNDIIVNGDVKRSSDADVLTGLVARNFVRVFQRGTETCSRYRTTSECRSLGGNSASVCPPTSQQLGDVEIDAAILALEHSFLVDNWADCRGGTLSITGSILQFFRGPVGTGSGSSTATGFVKDYAYDPTLKFKGPPYFPPPPSSDWRPIKVTEQLPAASPAG